MEKHDILADLRLEDFLELTTDAVIITDRYQQILLFNQAAAETFGYRPEEALGRTLKMLLPPGVLAAHKHHFKAFANGSENVRRMAGRQEISGRRKDGSIFPIEASIARFNLNSKTFLCVFLRDITTRKRPRKR